MFTNFRLSVYICVCVHACMCVLTSLETVISQLLMLTVPISTAPDEILFFLFLENVRLDTAYELSAKCMSHMKCQAIVSQKNKYISEFCPIQYIA